MVIMFDQVTQRLIKEGLLAIYREHPHLVHSTVYYLPLGDKPLEEIGASINVMHQLNTIPWPDTSCIICAEDHVAQLVLPNELRTLILLVRDARLSDRYRRVPRADHVDAVEPIQAYMSVLQVSKNAIRVWNDNITLSHMTGIVTTDKYLDQRAIEISALSLQRGFDGIPYNVDEIQNRLKKYWRAQIGTGLACGWHAHTLGGQSHFLSTQNGMGLAADILGYLSNIVFPCHYVLKSRFADGFGPPKIRRIMQSKPIFSVISYERLFAEYSKTARHTGYEVSPHQRRGHLRWYWQKALINRMSLPRRAEDRLKIAIEKRVPNTYIHPAWVGERTFEDGDIRHEIVTEETSYAANR